MIRVLHAVGSLRLEAGSIAVGLDGLLKSLRDVDIESTVVTREPFDERCRPADVVTLASADVAALIGRADVVHLHGLDRELAGGLIPPAKRRGVPYVISPLGERCPNPYEKPRWSERLHRAFYDKRLFREARAIGVLNRAEGESQVVPYGVDFSEYGKAEPAVCERADADEARTLLVLGEIHPDRGLVPLMRAVAELGRDFRGWRLVIAGSDGGGWLDQLQAAVERKGASDRAEFVVDPDLATQHRLLRSASLLAAPALRACCSISVGQALASGVPVLSSGLGLADGAETCVRICQPTRDGLREAVGEMIASVNCGGARLSEAARESARAFFDWASLRERFIGVYRSVCQ